MLRYEIRALGKFLPKPAVLYSTSVSSAKKVKSALIQKLSNEFRDVKPVIPIITKYDGMNTNFDEWKSRINIMQKHLFTDSECFEMISKYPPVLEIPLSKFEEIIEFWHHADLGLKNTKLLILNQPLLLESDKADIKKRLPRLRIFFPSPNSCTQLLINSPNVMFDNFASVLGKINYLIEVRGCKREEIVKFPVLEKSLDFIKFRFDLLEKCGIYKQNTKPVHKVNKYDKTEHRNPTLRDILMTDTKRFVKVAKISEEEYAVYEDLCMNSADDDDDDDDDSDDEGGGGYHK